jgi:hypothetical protein
LWSCCFSLFEVLVTLSFWNLTTIQKNTIYYENCVVTKFFFVNFVNEPNLKVKQDINIFLESYLILVIYKNSLSLKGNFFVNSSKCNQFCVFVWKVLLHNSQTTFFIPIVQKFTKKKPLVTSQILPCGPFFWHVSISF